MNKAKKSILFSIAAVLSASCLLIIFLSPTVQIFSFASEYIVHIMLIYIGLGLVAISLDQKHIMVLCLLSSGAIAFYLKMASNPDLIIPLPETGESIKVSLIDLNNCKADKSLPLKTIQSNQPQIVSFQHYNEDWNSVLQSQLYLSHPYIYKWHPTENAGLAIYSSIAFDSSYTLNFNNIPNAVIDFTFENEEFHLVSSYFPFSLNEQSQNKSDLLASMAAFIKGLDGHILNLGHFNEYYWSREMIEYRKLASLNNSRRQIDWKQGKVPRDHIFHSSNLKCITLEELFTSQKNHIGLQANYIVSRSNPKALTMN